MTKIEMLFDIWKKIGFEVIYYGGEKMECPRCRKDVDKLVNAKVGEIGIKNVPVCEDCYNELKIKFQKEKGKKS